MEPPREPRGVQNPRVVDLITLDAERDEVVLVMLEQRAWGPRDQLRQLEDKINSYLSYVLDGHLVEQYPQYARKPVRFRLDCSESPDDEARKLLAAARNFAAAERIGFEVNVIQG